MVVKTVSCWEEVNKATPYGKWFLAYVDSGAWTGHSTVGAVWKIASAHKPVGVSWSAWGKICGNLTRKGVPVSSVLSVEV